MDQLEKKILNELILDSRQSWTSLSEKLNISKTILKKKVKNLRESGIIEGFMTEINSKYYMIGFLFVFLKVSNKNEVYRLIKKLEELHYHYLIRDITDNIGLFYEISSIDEKEQLLRYLKGIPLISSIEVYQFSYSKEPFPRPISDVEWKIMCNLRNNSRTPGTKLAEMIDSTPKKVNEMIKQLLEEQFLFFTVKINPVKIQNHIMCFLLINLKKFDTNLFSEFLEKVQESSLFNPALIPFNNPPAFLINLLGRDLNSVQQVINEICVSPLIISFKNLIWKEYKVGHNWQDLLIEKKNRELTWIFLQKK